MIKCYHQKVISFFSPWAKIIHFFAILKYLIVDFNFKYRLNKKKTHKDKRNYKYLYYQVGIHNEDSSTEMIHFK